MPKAVSESTGTARARTVIGTVTGIFGVVAPTLNVIRPSWSTWITLAGLGLAATGERLQGGLSTAKAQAEEAARTDGVVVSKN